MGYTTNAMKPWFCYNLFLYLLNVFMQYRWNKYYCKWKALFSPQRSPPQSVPSCVVTQSAFCVCLHLPFDILPVMTMVNAAKTPAAIVILGAASTVHTVFVPLKH